MAIRVVEPAQEPVSLAEAKLHLRVDGTEDDGLITMLITSARQYVEKQTRRALINQTWRMDLAGFPNREIRLLPSPVQSITSVTVHDDLGNFTTLSATDYQLVRSEPARLYPGPTFTYGWEADVAIGVANAVRVTYVAGYGPNPTDVPAPLRQAILMMVGHWYQNREPMVGTNFLQAPHTVEAVIDAYRILVMV